jgi:four helix bundle protein
MSGNVVVDVDVVVDVVEGANAPLVHDLHGRRHMNYRNLDVYQKSVRFLPLASKIADRLPTQYAGLADQVRRASLSVVLNIAEGSGKTSVPDQRRFYAMARGSAMECGAIVDACVSLRLVDQTTAREAEDLLSGVVQMLSKMCRG